jgi:hypothetical protein
MVVTIERHRPMQPGRAVVEARLRQSQAGNAGKAARSLPDPGAAAKELHLAAAALVRSGRAAGQGWHALYDLLAQAVATQKTFEGQRLCREIAHGFAAGRGDEALEVCRTLVGMAGHRAPQRWFGSPVSSVDY